MKTFTRRTVLKSAALASTAASLRLKASPKPADVWPENGELLPDDGWMLQLEPEAKWAEDDIFLPEDIAWVNGELCGSGKPLAVRAPVQGWEWLNNAAARKVMLPTTVEQHFWGKPGPEGKGLRAYTPEEYRYAATSPAVAPADDAVPMNGAYYGVSWWHRAIDVPASMQGKRIFLHIRGARLRAEVFLNRKLVGYSIMEELPFECDLTHAAASGGENVLAIRLTNPFGRFDWVDGLNAKWGHVALHRSHGFAGLDRGMTISAHAPEVRIKDAWVLNTQTPKKFIAYADVESSKDDPVSSITAFVSDPKIRRGNLGAGSGRAMTDTYSASCGDSIGANGVVRGKCVVAPLKASEGLQKAEIEVTFPEADLWDLASPRLYKVTLTATTRNGKTDTRTVTFGFRTFGAANVGTNGTLRLNGRRLRIYSSISWGFWGLNGLFPVPELAEKEVTQAKALGLNCLNFHRNLPKEDVLRAHDRLGLLRYMEPGGGKLAIGKLPEGVAANAASIVMVKPTSDADKFAQRYMIAKCVGMVRASRSHPSVIEYCLQNEIGADLNNPDTLAVLAAMRAEDPSRCIVLNDGFVAPPRKAAQAWYEPWNEKLHRSDKEEWGGWWVQHQGAGDQWYDEFYKSPTEFTYKSPEHRAISEFGEMEGCARPDNHALMLHQMTETYKKYGRTSYDLFDHQEILNAYDRFLDQWKFRAAFPTAESLFKALGKTCYESWQNYLENARISDDLDVAVISGWESTSIENHSGIVDNLRNFKSDPGPIARTLQPVLALAKQRTTVVRGGDAAVFDLFLLNDTGKPANGTLTFSAITPSGKKLLLKTLAAPEQTSDTFSYLLQEGFSTPKLDEEGLYRFRFAISSSPLSVHTTELWVTTPPPVMMIGALQRVAAVGRPRVAFWRPRYPCRSLRYLQ